MIFRRRRGSNVKGESISREMGLNRAEGGGEGKNTQGDISQM